MGHVVDPGWHRYHMRGCHLGAALLGISIPVRRPSEPTAPAGSPTCRGLCFGRGSRQEHRLNRSLSAEPTPLHRATDKTRETRDHSAITWPAASWLNRNRRPWHASLHHCGWDGFRPGSRVGGSDPMIPALTNATPQRVTRDSGSQPSRAPLPIDAKGPARLASPGSPYDTLVLLKRAKQWRAEAARVAPGAMRAFCL